MKNNESNESRYKSDEPPHSRLFIVCSKSLTEDQFEEHFGKFGNIEETWIVKDKQSGESKGVAYIKYSKTSEAALAMESMNGEVISKHTRPLKVMIASSREQGSKRDDNDDRFLRLFIVVPKKDTELDIKDYFRKFGDVAYVKLVKDSSTKESKGFAYVKYHKMSHAAKAFEECDRSYRAVFAKPKEMKTQVDERPPYNSYNQSPAAIAYQERHPGGSHQNLNRPGDIINNFPNPEGFTKLSVVIPSHMPQDLIGHLFSVVPGMERCYPSNERMFSGLKVLIVQYSSPQSAAYAAKKLHGFEYPPGHRLSIKPEPDFLASPFHKSDSHGSFNSVMGRCSQGDDGAGGSMQLTTDLATLTKALSDATQIIKAAGLLNNNAEKSAADLSSDPNYCSATLPPPKPVAPPDVKCEERLFIVCQPVVPPIQAIWDVFGRFGDLKDIFILNGKNCGYILYASKRSAEQAITTLHGQLLCNSRLKVMLAEPPTNRENRKRQRVDDN